MLFDFSSSELFLLLLMVIFGIALMSERLHLPTPIALVVGGIGISLIPNIPSVPLDPEIVFLIFLPPLLMEAAYFTSLRDFRLNFRPIAQLAFGLVAVTTVSIGFLLIWILPDIPPAVAFTLGAIISPPDAIAATSIARRLKVPRRVLTIIEGESLINDASGLILYKFTVAAVVTGTFSWSQAGGQLVWAAIAGCAIGYVVSRLFVMLFRLVKETSIDTLLTFIIPYVAYVLAEAVHASGVLAVVVSGFVVSWYSSEIFNPEFRIRSVAVWKTVTFVLSGFVFILIGWQFPGLMERLVFYDTQALIWLGTLVSVATILVRLLWVFVTAYVTRYLFPSIRAKDPYPPWQNTLIVGWTGIRGVVSLAAAMALPYVTQEGEPFPHRDLLVFLTFCVILSTLVLQGLSLPWLIRKLRLYRFMETTAQFEAWSARKQATEAAMTKIDQLCGEHSLPESVLRRIHDYYLDRLAELGDGPHSRIFFDNDDGSEVLQEESVLASERRLWRELIEAERGVIVALRQSHHIGDQVMRDLEQELDLMQTQFSQRRTA